MPSIIRTLEQDEFWYGQDGRPYRLTEMEQSHRINVVHFLQRRAKQLQEHAAWWEERILEATMAPVEIVDEWAKGLDEEPEKWLERRPLMKALDRLIKEHDTIEGEVVSNEVARTSNAGVRFHSPTRNVVRSTR